MHIREYTIYGAVYHLWFASIPSMVRLFCYGYMGRFFDSNAADNTDAAFAAVNSRSYRC